MNGDARLTVVVPVHNGGGHLRATLDSLAAQTEAVVVVVVDDGSTDDSAAIAERHRAVDVVVRQPNRGVAASRNRGLALATTPYVAFLDQDDLWHESRAALLLDLAARSGAAAVATSEQVFARAGDRAVLATAGDPRLGWPSSWIEEGEEATLVTGALAGDDEVELVTVERLMEGSAFVTTAVMYEREAAIVAGGCAPFVRAADDHVLNVNVAHLFGPIPRIQRPALFYRIHAAATTNSSPLVLPVLSLQLALRHGRALPSRPVLGPNLEHLLSQVAEERGLTRSEQVALIVLSTPPGSRRSWLARWAKRSVRRSVRARRLRGSRVGSS